MNGRLFLAALLLGWIVAPKPGFGQVNSGGPDAYGYTWLNSDAPNGPVFQWIDLPNRAGAVQYTGLQDENAIGPINLGFDFQYYWRLQNQITIGSNGWLSFDFAPNIGWCFQSMPTAQGTVNNVLASLMTDLQFSSAYATLPNPGELWFWTNQLDSCVISYENVPFWKDDLSGNQPPDWAGQNSFQVILDASDSSITYQYLHLDSALFVNYAACPRDLIIGFEDPSGDIGEEIVRESVPEDSFAIRIIPPTQDTFELRDAYPVWSVQPGSKARISLIGLPLDFETRVGNLGNADLQSGTVVSTRLFDPQFSLLGLTTDTLGPVPPGAATPVTGTFTNGMSVPGSHYLRTSIQSPGDLNVLNNNLFCELVAVSDTGDQISISYAGSGTPPLDLAFPAGIGTVGAGIFMDYPFHDYMIESVDVFIKGDGSQSTPLPVGFRVDVFAADSGGPGNLLGSRLISAAGATEDAWNRVEFDPPIPADTSAVYIAWLQGGNGIGIGVETESPISRQSYEIINGQWTPFRRNNTEELAIAVNLKRELMSTRTRQATGFYAFEVGPNPGQGDLHFRWKQRRADDIEIQIYDMAGRQLFRTALGRKGPGIHHAELQTQLPKGAYQVILSNGKTRKMKKWIVTD